jgi:hypothetical protein
MPRTRSVPGGAVMHYWKKSLWTVQVRNRMQEHNEKPTSGTQQTIKPPPSSMQAFISKSIFISLICYLFIYSFIYLFIGGSGVWTQGFMLTSRHSTTRVTPPLHFALVILEMSLVKYLQGWQPFTIISHCHEYYYTPSPVYCQQIIKLHCSFGLSYSRPS